MNLGEESNCTSHSAAVNNNSLLILASIAFLIQDLDNHGTVILAFTVLLAAENQVIRNQSVTVMSC